MRPIINRALRSGRKTYDDSSRRGRRGAAKDATGLLECSASPPVLIRPTIEERRRRGCTLSQCASKCKYAQESKHVSSGGARWLSPACKHFLVFSLFLSPPPLNPQAVAHRVPYANIGKDRLWWASHRNSSSSPTVFRIFQPLFYIWPPSPFPRRGRTHYFPLSPRSLVGARERAHVMYVHIPRW